MKTALVTADWHLSSNSKDEYRHTFMKEKLPALIRSTGADTLIVLGDLTEAKDWHNAELVNAVVTYLADAAEQCHVIVMRGNHDGFNPTLPFFKFIQRVPHITWINEPRELQVDGLGPCLFLPHTRNHTEDWAKVDFGSYRRDAFIFCHNTFEGAVGSNRIKLPGIPITTLPKRAMVISGDIHVPQKLGPVTYVGAPYSVVFGDEFRPRLLQIGLTPHNTCQMQPVTYRWPKKCVIEVHDPREILDYDLNEGDMLKVRVHLKTSDYARWHEISARVRKWFEDRKCIVHTIQPIKEIKSIKATVRKPGATRDDKELLNHYGKRKAVAPDLMKTGHWLMEKV
jgi:UDP-2,3-diacylglucosamine pyrophosphatase LpxH